MNVENRIVAFEELGKYLNAIDEDEFYTLTEDVKRENPWFTPDSVRLALNGLISYLDGASLRAWTKSYELSPKSPKKVALIMAGNIPLVGFHDFLAVLISGHHCMLKLSSKDSILLNLLIKKLIAIEPGFADAIQIHEMLKKFDAVIATGSDNSARYFHYYFGKYPHIIRKNRTSCAIISGFESSEDLTTLGHDVFSYFGLGCRNVSKVYIPPEFDLTTLLKSWEPFHDIIHHHKYCNNYDYQKSILLVNRVPHLDAGFVLLQENEKLVSPISVIYYQYYNDLLSLQELIKKDHEKIQCIVGAMKPATIPFGQAQSPQLWDYADQIDTLKFLEGLNS
jgi:hypothetical protein